MSLPGTATTFDPTTRTGTVRLDDGTELDYDAAAFAAGGLRLLRTGQRVRIETSDSTGSGTVIVVSVPTLHRESS